MLMARKQAWATVLIVTVIAIFGGFIYKIATAPNAELSLQATQLYPEPKSLVAFTAKTHQHQDFSNEQLRGKWTVLFFGYTHCPDICPTTLAAMTSVQKQLSRDAVQFVFVTVDPERDNSVRLNEYVNYFSDQIIALHINEPALKLFSSDLGVAYMKVVEGDDYAMDHTVRIFVLDPKGRRYALMSPSLGVQGFAVATVVNDLKALLGLD